MSGCVVLSLPQGTIAEQPLKEALQREGVTLPADQHWLHTSGSAAFPYAWFFCDDAPRVASLLRERASCGIDVEVTALERAPPPPGLAPAEPAAGRTRRLESAVEPSPPPAPPLPLPPPPREDFRAASGPARSPQAAVSWKAGDWYCTCQSHNFAFRTECGRCRAPRSPLKRARDASWPEERPRSPPPPPRGVPPPATSAAAFLDALQSVPAAAPAPAGWAEHFPPPPPLPPQPVGGPSHHPEWASFFLHDLTRPAELHPTAPPPPPPPLPPPVVVAAATAVPFWSGWLRKGGHGVCEVLMTPLREAAAAPLHQASWPLELGDAHRAKAEGLMAGTYGVLAPERAALAWVTPSTPSGAPKLDDYCARLAGKAAVIPLRHELYELLLQPYDARTAAFWRTRAQPPAHALLGALVPRKRTLTLIVSDADGVQSECVCTARPCTLFGAALPLPDTMHAARADGMVALGGGFQAASFTLSPRAEALPALGRALAQPGPTGALLRVGLPGDALWLWSDEGRGLKAVLQSSCGAV